MATKSENANIIVEASDLLSELSTDIQAAVAEPVSAADADVSAGAVEEPAPRFATPGLNKLHAKIKSAEATAQAKVQAAVAAETLKIKVDSATQLAQLVQSLLVKVAAPETAPAPAPESAAEVALGAAE